MIYFFYGDEEFNISNEIKKHRFLRGNATPDRVCCFESKPPYVCNGCAKLNSCKKQNKYKRYF